MFDWSDANTSVNDSISFILLLITDWTEYGSLGITGILLPWERFQLKPATRLAILCADRRDRRKSPGVPGAAIAIFADRRDRRIKSPISGMSDIGD